MKSRHNEKLTYEERMRQNIIRDLNSIGITETAQGEQLHNSTYSELKYFAAVQMAKRG